MPPAIAMLSPFQRGGGQHVVRSLANGAQDGAVFVGSGWVSILERYAGGNDMPRIFGCRRPM